MALLPLVPFGTTGSDAGPPATRDAAPVEAARPAVPPSAHARGVAGGATDAPGLSHFDASAEARPDASATPASDPSVRGAGGSVQVEAGAVRFVEE